jgi:hypothetical protein
MFGGTQFTCAEFLSMSSRKRLVERNHPGRAYWISGSFSARQQKG